MIKSQTIALDDQPLCEQEIFDALQKGLNGQFKQLKVLVLIPDHTRSLPLPYLFRGLVETLHDVKQLDFMVALGTHPPLSEESLYKLVGITPEERTTTYKHIGVLNHTWDDPSALVTIGNIDQNEIKELAGDCWHVSLPSNVEVRLNRAVLGYDHIIIVGPTFPHEVAGFSGGAKYLFPGISGPEMIHATHWLGALSGVIGTIGVKKTPVRAMIHSAAKRLSTPVTLVALVVSGHDLAGVYVGDMFDAWSASADLSARRHIQWTEKPYHQVLSCAPPMYDELWTAAKAMYKLEPAVAIGGEVIIFAPHLETVSYVHGKYIFETGYHILPYFLENWEKYKHIPLGVLAHSTHLRGSGVMENGVEMPNIRVTLASRISKDDCTRLNLGYLDPAKIDIFNWMNREAEGILFVPRAGEILYRINN